MGRKNLARNFGLNFPTAEFPADQSPVIPNFVRMNVYSKPFAYYQARSTCIHSVTPSVLLGGDFLHDYFLVAQMAADEGKINEHVDASMVVTKRELFEVSVGSWVSRHI